MAGISLSGIGNGCMGRLVIVEAGVFSGSSGSNSRYSSYGIISSAGAQVVEFWWQ